MNLIDMNVSTKPQAVVQQQNTTNNNVKNNETFNGKQKPQYKDPLKNWPIKGLAYSNELGAVVSGISPQLGTALWVPALMYFGADIYDKYKTDETSYNPSKKRGVKEAVFQALASVVLPTTAVKMGQKAFSYLSAFSPTGLTLKAKDAVIEKSLEYMQSNSLHTFENNPEQYVETFKKSIMTFAQDSKGQFKTLPFHKKVLALLNSTKSETALKFANEKKLEQFAEKQAKNVMNMRSELMNNTKPNNLSSKLFTKFQQTKLEYQKIYPADKFLGKAAKGIIKEFHNNQLFNNKLVRTLGGFVALALLAKPIDDFVEHFIIKKTVEPGLDFISNGIKQHNERRQTNLVDKYSYSQQQTEQTTTLGQA